MKNKPIFYGWWIVAGCVVITATIVPLIMSLSGTYALAVTEELGISRSQFMIATMVVQITGIILSPRISKLVASGQMKRMQVIGVIGFALSYCTYSFAQSAWHLYLSSIFVGIFYWMSAMIPVSYMITMWFQEKRGLALSIAMAGIGLGGTILSQVVSLLLNNFGWRSTYQIMGMIALVCSLPIVLFVFKSTPAEKGLEPYGANLAKNQQSEGAKEENNDSQLTVKETYGKAFFWLVMMGMFLNGLINTGALSNFPAAIQGMHDPVTAANVISIYSFMGIFGKIILGWVNDKFGVVISSFFGCGAFFLAFILMIFGDQNMVIYMMGFVFGLGTPIGTVSPPLVTTAVFGIKNYPEAYGLINSTVTIGMAVGSVFVASILDLTGSYQTAWVLMAVFSALTLFGWVSAYLGSRKYFKNTDMETAE